MRIYRPGGRRALPGGAQHLVGRRTQTDIYREERNKALNRRRIKTQKKRDKVAPSDNDAERVAERTGKRISFPKPPKAGGRAAATGPKRPVVRRPSGASSGGGSAPRSGGAAPRANSGGGGGGGASASGGGSTGGGRSIRRTASGGGGGSAAAGGAAATTPADITAESIMKEFFGPALGELTRQETEAARTRDLQVADAERLRQWMAQQNTDAETFLQTGLDRARTAIPQTNSQLAEAQQRAAAAVGGNADLMKAGGIDAANAALAAQAPGDAAARTSPELQAGVFTRGLADQRGVTSATMANTLGTVNNNYNNRLSALATERAKLNMSAADLTQKERASQRTAAQDEKMFNLVAREKLGNLAVAQTNAETKRLQVITTAENARQAMSLKAQIEQGKMSRQDARDAFDQQLKAQNLSIAKRRLELARFDSETKRLKTNGADVAKLSDYVSSRYDTYLKQYNTTQWDAVPRDQQRKIVRNIVTGMRGAGGANLSQDQAIAILGGVFGDIPVRDPSFRRMITALWPR